MKYLVLFIVSIFFITTLLTSCTKYHSRSYDYPCESTNPVLHSNEGVGGYDEMNDFQLNENDIKSIEVYKIKFYHYV